MYHEVSRRLTFFGLDRLSILLRVCFVSFYPINSTENNENGFYMIGLKGIVLAGSSFLQS